MSGGMRIVLGDAGSQPVANEASVVDGSNVPADLGYVPSEDDGELGAEE